MMRGRCALCLWGGCELGREIGCDVSEWGLELYLSVFYGINQNVLF